MKIIFTQEEFAVFMKRNLPAGTFPGKMEVREVSLVNYPTKAIEISLDEQEEKKEGGE